MTEDIRERLYAQPFVPFTIHAADGKGYCVPTRDHAHVFPNGMRVDVYLDDGRTSRLPAKQFIAVETDAATSPDA